jgi:hypothetical protein
MQELFHSAATATKLVNGDWKSPLALLLEWANDQTLDHADRLKAADILMPYCHRKQPVATETTFSSDSPTEIKVKFVQPRTKPGRSAKER